MRYYIMQVRLHKIVLNDLSCYCYAKDLPANYEKAKAAGDVLCFDVIMPEVISDDGYASYRFTKANTDFTVTDAQLLELNISGVGFDYKQLIKVDIDPAEIFAQLATKNDVQITAPSANTYNNKCDVHMPGNMMASYNEIQLLEDSCTDVLQTSLNAGWRIIAACPQPDQRRPDYVLGRFNPNKDGNESSASRGN